MAKPTCITLLSSLPLTLLYIAFSVPSTILGDARFDVVTLGAKPDGKSDSSKAFLSAWSSACDTSGPATINVPSGSFYLESVVFDGPCKSTSITFNIAGTLMAPSDYNVIGSSDNWIIFRHVDGLNIVGGVLDGQGSGLWACKASGKGCPKGATNLEISNSQNVLVNGLSSVNSQMFHIVINGCENVKLQGVKVSALGTSPNTDGIHVSQSKGITILNSKIGTGDDCVSIGPGANNLWIENVLCGPGHGISIGSLGQDSQEEGVQNITVSTATFSGTQNGVRIKSWARPSSGFARDILFQHVIMKNVQNPIIIDQNYCPNNNGCPDDASGVKVSDITYRDIHGTSATEVAVTFDCSSENPCSGITMEEVNLTYRNQVAEASCENAGGTTNGSVRPASCL